jgi:hypothetical protein
MDEEKKSEASGEGAERVGPYLIQEQVQQSDDSQEELYLATNETSGATALVRKHAAEEGKAPQRRGCQRIPGEGVREFERRDPARHGAEKKRAERRLRSPPSSTEPPPLEMPRRRPGTARATPSMPGAPKHAPTAEGSS